MLLNPRHASALDDQASLRMSLLFPVPFTSQVVLKILSGVPLCTQCLALLRKEKELNYLSVSRGLKSAA